MKKIGVVGLSGGWSSEMLIDTVKKKTGFHFLVDMEKISFDMESQQVFCDGENLAVLGGCPRTRLRQF